MSDTARTQKRRFAGGWLRRSASRRPALLPVGLPFRMDGVTGHKLTRATFIEALNFVSRVVLRHYLPKPAPLTELRPTSQQNMRDAHRR